VFECVFCFFVCGCVVCVCFVSVCVFCVCCIRGEYRVKKGTDKTKTKTSQSPYRGVVLIHVEDAVEFEPAVQHELALHVGVHARVV
jgi:hypothetical protein